MCRSERKVKLKIYEGQCMYVGHLQILLYLVSFAVRGLHTREPGRISTIPQCLTSTPYTTDPLGAVTTTEMIQEIILEYCE